MQCGGWQLRVAPLRAGHDEDHQGRKRALPSFPSICERSQGLGKTVTGIALMLRTRGTLANPPPGATVRVPSTGCTRTDYALLHLT